MSDSLILASYGIDVTDLEIYEVLDQNDREVSIRIRLRRKNVPCPDCGAISDIGIKDYKHNLCYANKLFLSAQLCYINTSKKCPKNHEMEKKIICNNIPNYLMINCVWNHKPNIDKVMEFFTLLSLKNRFNDLFEVPPQKKKNLKY